MKQPAAQVRFMHENYKLILQPNHSIVMPICLSNLELFCMLVWFGLQVSMKRESLSLMPSFNETTEQWYPTSFLCVEPIESNLII